METTKDSGYGVGNRFREMMGKAREGGRQEMQDLFEKHPEELSRLFAKEPNILSSLLGQAAEHFEAGAASNDELKVLSDAFVKLPSLSSKLLSGMGA